jgi:hypothetical protein
MAHPGAYVRGNFVAYTFKERATRPPPCKIQ